MSCTPTVIRVGAGGGVTVRGGASRRVTIDRSMVARINDNRNTVIPRTGHTPVRAETSNVTVRAGSGMGVQGPPGRDGDKHFAHRQDVPSDIWHVVHGLGKRVAVTVIDSAGEAILTDVEDIDADSIRIHFAAPLSGVAYCN